MKTLKFCFYYNEDDTSLNYKNFMVMSSAPKIGSRIYGDVVLDINEVKWYDWKDEFQNDGNKYDLYEVSTFQKDSYEYDGCPAAEEESYIQPMYVAVAK